MTMVTCAVDAHDLYLQDPHKGYAALLDLYNKRTDLHTTDLKTLIATLCENQDLRHRLRRLRYRFKHFYQC